MNSLQVPGSSQLQVVHCPSRHDKMTRLLFLVCKSRRQGTASLSGGRRTLATTAARKMKRAAALLACVGAAIAQDGALRWNKSAQRGKQLSAGEPLRRAALQLRFHPSRTSDVVGVGGGARTQGTAHGARAGGCSHPSLAVVDWCNSARCSAPSPMGRANGGGVR